MSLPQCIEGCPQHESTHKTRVRHKQRHRSRTVSKTSLRGRQGRRMRVQEISGKDVRYMKAASDLAASQKRGQKHGRRTYIYIYVYTQTQYTICVYIHTRTYIHIYIYTRNLGLMIRHVRNCGSEVCPFLRVCSFPSNSVENDKAGCRDIRLRRSIYPRGSRYQIINDLGPKSHNNHGL